MAVDPGEARCRSCGWPAPRILLVSYDGATDAGGEDMIPVSVEPRPDAPSAAPAQPDPGRLGSGASAGPSGNWPSAPPPDGPQQAPGYPVYPQGAYPQSGYPQSGYPQSGYPQGYGQGQPYQPYPYAPYPGQTYPGQAYPSQPSAVAAAGSPAPYPPNPQYQPYPYQYPYMPAPRKASRPVYPLVVSWIVTVTGGLSLILGLLILGIVLLFGNGQPPTDLLSLGAFAIYTVPPILGGLVAIISGILGILRHPSPRFVLPSAVLLLGLGVLAMAAGVVFDNLFPAPGPAIAVLPLVITAVSLPAFALLAFTGWRLGFPSTQRHTWLSFFYGTTLAALVAGLLNTIFAFIVVLILDILGFNLDSSAVDPTSANPHDFGSLLAIILVVAVVAPFVEEGMKPLGAVLIMRRLRTPAQAFLVGMASGVGFAIVETVGDYAGQAQADWVAVAIERSTSSLLHGVGAGMGALGWYYLINGKGVPLRWLRGFGSLAYAVLQHGIFNGVIATGIALLPDPIGPFFQQTVSIGILPISYDVIAIFAYDALILGWLLFITSRLRPRQTAPGALLQSPGATDAYPRLQPVAGGAR
jgi:RsiW-degrading membrane proteinase PrsW (M82 family)